MGKRKPKPEKIWRIEVTDAPGSNYLNSTTQTFNPKLGEAWAGAPARFGSDFPGSTVRVFVGEITWTDIDEHGH